MRGKATNFLVFGCAFGITPAYAGKSLTAVLLIHGGRDHPRLCGEKHFPIKLMCPPPGSPPPMRGKVRLTGEEVFCYGITPAYAGKRYGICWNKLVYQDHPRLCGEKPILSLPPP